MCISYELASSNLTFFAYCCYVWVMLILLTTFFALLLLIVADINICTFSSDVSSKFGLRFTIAAIHFGSMSLNLSKVISFPIFLCQFRIFLIILHNSIKIAFSVIWCSNVYLHFFILKIPRIQPCFNFRITLNFFLFYKLIFWNFNHPWEKLA